MGVKPSVLRILPGFWSVGYRLLVVDHGEIFLFAASMNYRRVGEQLAHSSAAQLAVDVRALGRQMVVEFPNQERVVLDGKRNVERGHAALGAERGHP